MEKITACAKEPASGGRMSGEGRRKSGLCAGEILVMIAGGLCENVQTPDVQTGRNVMQKLVLAAVATAALGVMAVSVAAAADAQGARHRIRHHVWVGDYGPYFGADPAVRGPYVMNGNFDWRRRGEHRPWYAHGYNDDCVAWSPDAYHYACDPNYRY
jgi:hypothetical protein